MWAGKIPVLEWEPSNSLIQRPRKIHDIQFMFLSSYFRNVLSTGIGEKMQRANDEELNGLFGPKNAESVPKV